MKKTIKIAVVAALALGATSAFATNGSTLIGMGAKTRGMGGAGIGVAHGAESALVNPALITSIKKDHEISFGGTLFMPDVENAYGTGAASVKSDADMNVIPEVSVAGKVTDSFYAGVGIWGTAGMGTDYRNSPYNMNMVTNLQLMQFGVPLAYTTGNFSVAVTPILQYGSLDINYDMDGNVSNGVMGMGQAQDLAFGYNVGIAYEMSGLTIGAVYKSKIDMEYKGFANVVQPFINPGSTYTNNELSTPAEMGIGASYKIAGNTIALDYKRIKWSDAKGYKDFEWDDQNVLTIGYEYATQAWALRAGYNYASSPISEQSMLYNNAAGLNGLTINMFNLLGFPAIVESHYAVGGTYNISGTTSVDLAFTYAPEVTNTYSVPYGMGMTTMTTKHSQTGVSAQVNFAF
jgi:long-chain fatty acid transport protein